MNKKSSVKTTIQRTIDEDGKGRLKIFRDGKCVCTKYFTDKTKVGHRA